MLWNHEGIRRGPTFVTRKITTSVSNQIKKKNVQPIQIGNLDTHRDWGNADEYCNAMILIMESDKPDDYAVNTGESHTIREFIEETYKYVNIKIIWKGIGMEEKGYDENNNLLVEVNPYYYRNTDVLYLHRDYSKIKNALGWEPKTKFKELVQIMMRHDLDE
jgi:GDPmannose 4,6-dehydratase